MDDVKIILGQIQSLSYADMIRLSDIIRDAIDRTENARFVLSGFTGRNVADALSIAKYEASE